MDQLNWNGFLHREKQEQTIIDFLNFHRNKTNGNSDNSLDNAVVSNVENIDGIKIIKNSKDKCKSTHSKRKGKAKPISTLSHIPDAMGLFITGSPGSGKTCFIKNLIHKPEIASNFDFIYFNSADQRNKNIISDMTSQNMTSQNVHQMFFSKKKQLVFVMDDINHMNQTDKFGLNILIKMLRTKKTKKQKGEITTNIPVICIGNKSSDKKLKDLSKGCICVTLDQPNDEEINTLLKNRFPDLSLSSKLLPVLLNVVGGDLRKFSKYSTLLSLSYKYPTYNQEEKPDDIIRLLQQNRGDVVKENLILNTIDDSMTKLQVKNLYTNYYPIIQHRNHLLEADRTTISMIWHENVVDLPNMLSKQNMADNQIVEFYVRFLKNLAFGDVLDRVTFLKQIWHCNEISSLIKTYYNNYILHYETKSIDDSLKQMELRFTKILTRYSTEYNNTTFKNMLSQRLILDRKDLNYLFYNGLYLKTIDINELLEINDITELEQKRYLKMMFYLIGINQDTSDEHSSGD
jgi:hypothetical protein